MSATKIKRDTLGGKEINEARLATVPDAAKLGGKAPSAYLAATGKATDADRLDGKDAAAFLAASKVQAVGPVSVTMPAVNNASTTTPLLTVGEFALSGFCTNSGGLPIATIAIASSSGGQYDAANRSFSAVAVPASGPGMVHGDVTTIADNGTTKQCLHAVTAVAG